MLAASAGLYLAVLAAFALIWARSTRVLSVPTPLAVFAAFECIAVWPATMSAQATGYSLTGAFPALLAAAAFTAMLVGFVVTMGIFKCDPAAAGAFRAKAIVQSYAESSYLLAVLLTTGVLLALGAYLYQGFPPLLSGLGALAHGGGVNSAIDIVASGRQQISKGYYLGGTYRGQGVITEVMNIGWPYLLVVAILLYRLTRKLRWLVLVACQFFFMFVFIAGSGERFPILEAIIGVGVTLAIVVRLRVKWLVAGVAVLLLLYSGMSRLNSNFEDIGKTNDPSATFLTLAADRIATGNGIHNIDIINLVRDGALPLALGRVEGQRLLQSIPGFGKNERPFESTLWHLIHPEAPESDSTWATATYFGLIYADFGTPGVLLTYVALGGMLALAQQWVFSQPKRLVALPALGYVLIHFGSTPLDGPTGPGTNLIMIAVFYAAFLACIALVDAARRQARVSTATRGRPGPAVSWPLRPARGNMSGLTSQQSV